MQRLRSTFKRSRTPTGSEMKSQSSLEVPKQVRSASFDEIQLEAQRQDDQASRLSRMNTSSSSSSTSPAKTNEQKRLSTLRVPQLASGQRSKSFDVCGSLLPTSPARSSGSSGSRKSDTPLTHISGCYHCACLEEYKAQFLCKDSDNESDNNNDDNDDDDNDDDNDLGIEEDISLPIEDEGDNEDLPRDGSPEIRVTMMSFDKPPELEISPDSTDIKVDIFIGERPRRLSRQEAVISFPGELAFAKIALPSILGPDDDEDESRGDDDDDDRETDDENKCDVGVRDIYLTVPELKRDRAASVDSCFNNKNGKGEGVDSLAVPQQSTRSKSVDIVLPTDQQTRYTALLPSKDQLPRGSREETVASGSREPRSTPDWGPDSVNGEHLWVSTAASGDFCYASECSKHGQRLKCAACRIIAHSSCTSHLNFECKASFRDVGVRQYREQTSTHHHWVHRRSQKGKCANCSKAFQSKLSFSSKEIVAVSCSWCKLAYHNKEACFNVQRIGENCELGTHKSIIVPPSWMVKLPRKGSFKSSLRKSPRRKKSSGGGGGGGGGVSNRRKNKDKDKEKDDKDQGKLWVVKPIPTATIRPVLVFINPKSGGNQGAKLLQKFQWLLNPRQVFDLTQGGPKMGLELFKKVPNLRVLACGGDGTVGWVLSILDQIGYTPPPAVGVLPLGTGNDLARALGWGGGYTDEPIGKILCNIGDSDTTLLDRWSLEVTRNPDASNDDDGGKGKDNLPLNVVNNYFSLGVDAHIALEFHEAREAHPEKFNSRLRNKMFYGQMGGKDLVRRKWKDLSEFVTLECDGQDMTPKLKEHRVHAIVFLNIASYGGGTHPWGAASGTREPATDDGLFEVVGLTTYQLPLLQAGGHGTCITQCSTAKLVTTRTIPMQVDGEACRVLPSIIEMKHLNKATMLAKRRSTRKPYQNVGVKLESLKLPLMRIKMRDYEAHHSDKDRLKKTAVTWREEPLELEATMDLESLRELLSKDYPMESCCFLDSCTAERFFRIDRGQEQLHYVTDVASEAVYVLEEDNSGQTVNETESATARASPNEERPRGAVSSMAENRFYNRQKESHGNKDKNERSIGRRRDTSPPIKGQKNPMKYEMNDEKYQKSSSSKQSVVQSVSNFISPRERLFGLTSDVHTFSTGLLEKTSDAIIRSAKVGDFKTLKELHERGYSLLSIDSSGQTALHIASRYGHKEIVRYLIACAPPTILNMIDNDKGQTALHKAVQQKRRSICCILVAGGATLSVRDRHGNTPRQLALAIADEDLAAYLESQEQFLLMTEQMMQNIP